MLSLLTKGAVILPALSPVFLHAVKAGPFDQPTAAWSSSEQRTRRGFSFYCGARRKMGYVEDEDLGDETEGYNEEIAMLEMYTQSAPGEALIVHTAVDEDDVEVLIFKGFSSCLSHGTLIDPSRSVVPVRAVIKSIDRIKGPFDPSNIEFIQKGLTWDGFKTLMSPNT